MIFQIINTTNEIRVNKQKSENELQFCYLLKVIKNVYTYFPMGFTLELKCSRHLQFFMLSGKSIMPLKRKQQKQYSLTFGYQKIKEHFTAIANICKLDCKLHYCI